MMMRFLVLLFGTVSGTIVDCGLGKSIYKINSLEFYPDPPIKNQNATVTLDYTVPEGSLVTAGTSTYAIKYSFIPLTPTVEDLCTQTACPITPGNYKPSSSSLWPDGLNGKVELTSTWKDSNSNLLLCYKVSVSV